MVSTDELPSPSPVWAGDTEEGGTLSRPLTAVPFKGTYTLESRAGASAGRGCLEPTVEPLLESPTAAQNAAVPPKPWPCTALATEAPIRFPRADTCKRSRGQEVGGRALLSLPTLPRGRRWALLFDGPQLTDGSTEPTYIYSKYILPVSRVISSNNTGNLLCTRRESEPLIYCSIHL